jgi:DNA-binding IclR family transcriptional regulator
VVEGQVAVSSAGTYHVGVLARAYAILNAVSETPRTVAELSEELGADSRTVYRITRNLETNGFLRRVSKDQHRFALGFRLLQLGNRASEQLDLRMLAADTLRVLASSSGESALLSIRSGLDVVFAKRVDGGSSLRLSVEEGSRQPLPMGAVGKVLTAFSSREVEDEVLAQHPLIKADGSKVEPEAMRSDLEEIRQRGLAISRSEFTLGAGSIAAPVRDGGGTVIAAISIAGPESRVLDANRERNIQAVIRAAEELNSLLST